MTKRLSTSSERKRRPDAWEIKAHLSDADLRRVFGWCQNLGYGRAIDLIEKELKIKAPSSTTLADWYEYFSVQVKEDRVHKAIVDGAAVRAQAESCGDISEAMTKVLESEASAAILSGDPDRIKLLVSLALKARGDRYDTEKLNLERRKLEIRLRESESKLASAAAALDKTRTGELDPTALADEMDRILGRRKS
jgi:hypothetical protein